MDSGNNIYMDVFSDGEWVVECGLPFRDDGIQLVQVNILHEELSVWYSRMSLQLMQLRINFDWGFFHLLL